MARKKNYNSLPPFVPLLWELLNHDAYKELPFAASKALPYFIGKVKYPYCSPEAFDHNFTFSYPEAKKLGFAPGTFSNIIRDLERHGFISVVSKGGLKGKGKGYNKFRLSKKWRTYGNMQESIFRAISCEKVKSNSTI